MKLKDYMNLSGPGAEITCWDKDIDSEFYFYTKEIGESTLYGKDFPNVERCTERWADILDVVKIHDRGVEVNLYEKLEHPKVIEFAKENFYTENQYEDNDAIAMLLFNDNNSNFSNGYEQFSGMMADCLDMVYGPAKEAEKVNIFGLTVVNSEGYFDGTQAKTSVFNSFTECVDAAYESYTAAYNEVSKLNILDDPENNKLLSKEDFAADFKESHCIVLQLVDSHIQFEYFESQLELPDKLLTNEIEKTSSEITEDLVNQVEELNANTPDGIIRDGDTILVDLLRDCDFTFSGISQDIFNIWKESSDKKAVEQMFYEFTDTEFSDYLKKCISEISRPENEKPLPALSSIIKSAEEKASKTLPSGSEVIHER